MPATVHLSLGLAPSSCSRAGVGASPRVPGYLREQPRALATVLAENGVPVGAVIATDRRCRRARPCGSADVAFAGRSCPQAALLHSMVIAAARFARTLLSCAGPTARMSTRSFHVVARRAAPCVYLRGGRLDTTLPPRGRVVSSRYPDPLEHLARAMMRGTAVVATQLGNSLRSCATASPVPGAARDARRSRPPGDVAARLRSRRASGAQACGGARRAQHRCDVDRFEALYATVIGVRA